MELKALRTRLRLELALGGEICEAFDALLRRGYSRQYAFDLLFRAKGLCDLEVQFGLPNRWPAVAKSLADGATLQNLFSPDVYRHAGEYTISRITE